MIKLTDTLETLIERAERMLPAYTWEVRGIGEDEDWWADEGYLGTYVSKFSTMWYSVTTGGYTPVEAFENALSIALNHEEL